MPTEIAQKGTTVTKGGRRNLAFGPLLQAATLAIAFGCTIWYAHHRVFSYLSDYDDEGYMLLSLSHFAEHGGLYSTTFAQYGPFFFYLQQFLHWLFHLPFNHNGARTLSLGWWIAASLLEATFVWRLTRSAVMSAWAMVSVALMAVVFAHEPGHPQEVVLGLLAAALLAALLCAGKERAASLGFLLLGGVAAGLLLTKINVGVYFSAALTLTLVTTATEGRLRRWLLRLFALVAVVGPPLLMHLYWAEWSARLGIVAIETLLLLVIACMRINPQRTLAGSSWWSAAMGLLSVTAVVCGACLAQGTPPAAILNGVLLRPLSHPAVFTRSLRFQWTTLLVSLVVFLSGLLFWSRPRIAARHCYPVAVCKIAAALLCFPLLVNETAAWTLAVVEPLLTLLLVHTDEAGWALEDLFPRFFLCALSAWQVLQPYPVAGSQVSIALIPAVAWAAVLLADGVRALPRFAWERARFGVAGGAVAALLLATGVAQNVRDARHQYAQPSSGLRGAERIHLDPGRAAPLRTLAEYLHEHCGMLFTMPGMGSFNLWSAVPPPNGLNLTAWMTAFHPAEQEAIVKRLHSAARPCVVVDERLLRFWMPEGPLPLEHSAIADYVRRETAPVHSEDEYEVRVPVPRLSSPNR